MASSSEPLRRIVPGRLFAWVKRASWFELALFSALVAFWLLPDFEAETMIFGWAHGIGFILLCLLIWASVLRHESPYTLLAATLTPVGPLGSVIAIAWLERRQKRVAGPEQGGDHPPASDRGSERARSPVV